jgi:hypothetical protein
MSKLYHTYSQEIDVAAARRIVFGKKRLKMKIESEKIDRSTFNGSQGLVSKNGPFHPTGDRGTQFSKLYCIYPGDKNMA